MEPRTTLPLEILLYIIDLLGDIQDSKSLKNLSQACKSMVPPCRKHLFSSLCLIKKREKKSFTDLLSQIPDITRYVTILQYKVHNPISDHDLNILDTLKKFLSLKMISLSSTELDWNDIPESIRSSLVSLFELPTVIQLYISSFKGFPATALSGCINLDSLVLGDIDIVFPEANQVISRSEIPKPRMINIRRDTHGLVALLNSASLHAGGPIIDLSRLYHLTFDDVELPDDIVQVNELIKVSTYLDIITIFTDSCVDQPLEFTGLGASLAVNAYRTLTYIELSVTVVGDDHDPLCGLSHELRFIAGAGNNILEQFKLDVVVKDDAPCRTEPEDWSAFDSLLTESGAFPYLIEVLVVIWWNSVHRTQDEFDRVGESLKQDKFPRLVESKELEFIFRVEHHWNKESLTRTDSD